MTDLIPLAIGVLIAQASPGPNMMAVAAQALGVGRAAALWTAAGVAAGVFVWAALFKLGAGVLLAAAPWTLTAMKLLGGGYLLFLALKSLRAAWRGGSDTELRPGRSGGLGHAFGLGFGVVLTNPKAALMWVAIAAYLAATPALSGAFVSVGLAAAASAFLVYGAYALMFSAIGASRVGARVGQAMQAAFAAAFGALGGRLVIDGLRDLRS